MILGLLFLLGAGALFFLAWRQLRRARAGGWTKAEGTRLLVTLLPGREAPSLMLESGGATLFGPVAAAWDPPRGMAGVPAPVVGSATYRVLAVADLGAEDALATGDARLARSLRDAFGGTAMVLAPETTDRPILLHGQPPRATGSAGGVGIEQARLDGLLAVVGDAQGLRVEIVRRRLQRGGWGTQKAVRQRAG